MMRRRDGVWAETGRIHLADMRRTWLSFKTKGGKQLAIDVRSEEGRSSPRGLAAGNIVINNTLHKYVSHLSKHFLHL